MTINNSIKVIVVDDSAFARLAISRELQSGDGIVVIDCARDGNEAIEKIKLNKPDVVTLDVEMPGINGLETLSRIMSECPVPVVMLSSVTGSGSDTTIRALEMGAVDFFLKHSISNPVGADGNAISLRNKIKTAALIKVKEQTKKIVEPAPVKPVTPIKKQPAEPADRLVIIGSSTGGPKALYQVIPSLPADIPAAVLVVQHMPVGFTHSLANRLNQLSKVTVKEAEEGDLLYKGRVIIAKGGYHLVLDKDGAVSLVQTPPVCGVRPSVDVTMKSAVPVFGREILGVVLTGMGSDGTMGAQSIKMGGGRMIVEDETTCVVWGMPKSVQQNGYADEVLPLGKISDGIVSSLRVKA